MQQAMRLAGSHVPSPVARDMLACAADELTGIGDFEPQHGGDLAVGIVEGLAQDERRPFGPRKLLQHDQNG